METIYLTKEELIQFLNDYEVKSIRIVAEETHGTFGVEKCTSTMIDIITTNKISKKRNLMTG